MNGLERGAIGTLKDGRKVKVRFRLAGGEFLTLQLMPDVDGDLDYAESDDGRLIPIVIREDFSIVSEPAWEEMNPKLKGK